MRQSTTSGATDQHLRERAMVPNSFVNYFTAMAAAGGALIGLLFVAISISIGDGESGHPERGEPRQRTPGVQSNHSPELDAEIEQRLSQLAGNRRRFDEPDPAGGASGPETS